jgi:hypothetical protein
VHPSSLECAQTDLTTNGDNLVRTWTRLLRTQRAWRFFIVRKTRVDFDGRLLELCRQLSQRFGHEDVAACFQRKLQAFARVLPIFVGAWRAPMSNRVPTTASKCTADRIRSRRFLLPMTHCGHQEVNACRPPGCSDSPCREGSPQAPRTRSSNIASNKWRLIAANCNPSNTDFRRSSG